MGKSREQKQKGREGAAPPLETSRAAGPGKNKRRGRARPWWGERKGEEACRGGGKEGAAGGGEERAGGGAVGREWCGIFLAPRFFVWGLTAAIKRRSY